jgi:hypothetical protein
MGPTIFVPVGVRLALREGGAARVAQCGTSGSASERVAVVTASARNLPASDCGSSIGRVRQASVTFLFRLQIGRSTIQPILSSRREDIDVNCVFSEDELVWNVGRDNHDVAGLHDKLSSLRVDFSDTLDNPRDLLVHVVSKRNNCTFLRNPLHERNVRSAEVLPREKVIDFFYRLCVEVEELGFAGYMLADILQDAAPRSVLDLRNELGRNCRFGCSGGVFIPIPDRFESNPTPANGNWIAATASPRIQSDLEAVLVVISSSYRSVGYARSIATSSK